MDLEPAVLDFWFDFASTYSYVGAMQIEELCRAAGVPIRWKPFLLGPIFARQGLRDSPFNVYPRRGAYMWRDLERLCHKHGFPWRQPTRFPRSSTLPARVACLIADEPWCGDFVRRIFVANFGEDREIGELPVVAKILEELGKPSELIGTALDESHRGLLRTNTAQADALELFGAPNCIVNGEIFWGEEALADAVEWARRPSA